ncbi:DgyrCDS7547 [Dimorphilus gyrociliatus]|uniref:aspartate transaminase n=1 Tax=Dimorphilus gyrociliatus TaxID=2664684 RepID=A0A7I8VTL0_9ANNE|nr:DgyrCDS7547 [Dimorphilus gyrociliatus]
MAASVFQNVESVAPIEVFKLSADYRADPNPQKVNLGVGAYRTDDGEPWVLPVVRAVEAAMAQDQLLNHEYLPISGLGDYSKAATALLLGSDNKAIAENRAAGFQACGGTGALRIGLEFLKRNLHADTLYVSNPTWGNHKLLGKMIGYTNIREYRYWNQEKRVIDFEGFVEDLQGAPGFEPGTSRSAVECSATELYPLATVNLQGHPDLNRGPLDLQSNALPLSYTPSDSDLKGAPGFEPGTSRSAVECSATELYPHCKSFTVNDSFPKFLWKKIKKHRGHPDLNQGPLDLQSNALPLSYTPKNAPEGAVIMFHMCAHNPTGMDPTMEQWAILSDIVKKRKLFPFFDCAYQGFSSGDVDKDAASLRFFVKEGHEILASQSFSKNFGLYNERTGNLIFIASSATILDAVKTQMEVVIRTLWSNPPNHGARIVATVLNKNTYKQEWLEHVKDMANRILLMRQQLFEKFRSLGTKGNWDHIVTQTGMFSYTGLTPQQVEYINKKYHIYMLKSGRINMCGLTTKNMDYVANAIHDAVTNITENKL